MRENDWNKGVVIFLVAYHLILLVTLPIYFYLCTPKLSMIIISIILYFITGISITAGYHRYYSHRTYRAHPIVEFVLLFFGSMAGQGSALRWSFDHRLHHAHVDTDEDPYSINKGFWYAHCLWLKNKPKAIEPKVVPDLLKNKLVMFQDRHAISCMVVSNFIVFLFFGWLLNDFWGACMLATWTRLFALHHSTWFINSLAHTWGNKPFCQEQTAVNNCILSFLTFGEGYHNYHHTFANDYRNGVRWFHFDPTKWMIWILSRFGLTSDLKRMDWYSIRKRMVLERKGLLMERLESLWDSKKEELQKHVDEISEQMLTKIAQLRTLREKYHQMKKDCVAKDLLKPLRDELKDIKRGIRHDWRTWKALSRHIMKMRPA